MQVTVNFRRATRWVAAAALLAGLGLTAGAGTAARADGSSPSNDVLFSYIALSGDVNPPGQTNPPIDWVPPKCWLEPNAGLGVPDAYDPAGFANYIAAVDALYHHTGDDALRVATDQIYSQGHNADSIVGITDPPFNNILAGKGMWYKITCTIDAGVVGYTAFKQSLGVTNDAEEWFWLTNGAPPPGIQTADPNMLAEYAAANTLVQPGWPAMSPAMNATQTVNLPTLVTNAAGDNGFRAYTARATLVTGQYSEVTANPESVTFTSKGLSSSVTCNFNPDGSLQAGCQLNWRKSSAIGYALQEVTTWTVTWAGDAGTGEAGWTKHIGPFTLNGGPVVVQEIQTVVGGQ